MEDPALESAAANKRLASDDEQSTENVKRTRTKSTTDVPSHLDGAERAFPYAAYDNVKPEGPLPEDETCYIREADLDSNPMVQFGKFFAKVRRLKWCRWVSVRADDDALYSCSGQVLHPSGLPS